MLLDKRVSLDPLDGETALRALLRIKPEDAAEQPEPQDGTEDEDESAEA